MSLVLTGPAFIFDRWQVRSAADSIGWTDAHTGDGFLITGIVALTLGLGMLASAYGRRRLVEHRAIAVAGGALGFIVTGNLIAFGVPHFLGLLI